MADTNINAILTSTNVNVNVEQTVINTNILPTEIKADFHQDVILNSELNDLNITATLISGARGKSAYDIWKDSGYSGTEEDFLSWLRNGYNFIYEQVGPSSEWTINHFMGKFPSVTVVDSGGTWVIGDVQYITNNQLIISFRSPFAGKAYLN